MRWLTKFVVANQDFLEERIREELPLAGKPAFGGLRNLIATRVAAKLAVKVEETLQEILSDPTHDLRVHLHAEMIVLSQRLRDDPLLASKMEDWKEGLLEHQGVLSASDAIWMRLKHTAAGGLESPDEALLAPMLAEAPPARRASRGG